MTGTQQSLAVLLCTYNGGRFLAEQLDSIAFPVGVTGHIYVSDDGSSDDTLSVLGAYTRQHGAHSLSIRRGPGTGHCANFLSLLCAPDIQADYFAFCDQDDVWDSDKLARALEALAGDDAQTPALYGSRTRSLAESAASAGLSPLFARPPAFANALIQNIAGGNTMVMNAPARTLLQEAGPVDVVMHDWWCYLLVSGAGGAVTYDPRPSLMYRQHEDNLVGANMGIVSRCRRYLKALGGTNRDWNARNVAALRQADSLLTEQGRASLAHFEQLHNGGLLQRLGALRRGGFYAQTRSANLGLFFATLLKKI
ncbi:glycosyltransferase family 2 protein [Pseudohalioglobus lutimaris]|uniref:Glycosyl transferase family 2 n=1 Tax=Pseudohalioglobus lutimaris TaxID=1737061 RepID=A0A2N5X7E9_9GAMM|nr:glycosyltransferase family 2 protein [Pseudohalioglobus lutimaris]PLW70409.1 glycosyl transferase family 2 [Pseudohalioglobus lutimaris]